MDSNKEKTIIATGGTSQLQPINEYSNIKTRDEYADECIKFMFPCEIYLFENKRLKSNEDNQTIKHIEKYVFNNDINVMSTIRHILNSQQTSRNH